MIRLTRLNGSEFSLNPDLIHRAEETPDTVLTLIDGSRYVVEQGLEELIDRIVGYRARVVAAAGLLAEGLPGPATHAVQVARAAHEVPQARGPAGHPDEPTLPDDDAVADVVRLRTRRS